MLLGMAFYRFELHAPVTPPELVQRLQAVSCQPKFSLLRAWPEVPPGYLFIGEVTADAFALRRHIRYRNSFLPQISGQISADGSGSRVVVGMSPHLVVIIFMLFWLSLPTFMLFSAPFHGWERLIPLGFIAFGLGLVSAGFWPEALKARRMLTELCEAPRQTDSGDEFPKSLL
ncbi:hypothetical protein [Chitinimonas sp.]|uniref:hypothetical protein n=1 Tax=Chitinimonas sp. TaxID=1934313 RepID=UPI002F93120A